MRTRYIFLIIAFLFMCAASRAQNTNGSSSRPRTNTDERLILQKEFFPRIPDGTTARALPTIASYAKKLDLKPLEKNHVRFFVQPMGIVSQAIDVNLVSGEFVSYPGTNDRNQPRKNTIDSRDLSELRNMLISKDFLDIPSTTRKMGADGGSFVIEVDFNDSYKWISHWVTEDKNLLDTMQKLNDMVAASWIYSYTKKIGEGTLKANHIRLFEPEGLDVAYSITDIDLVTGKLVRRQQGGTTNKTLNKEQISQLKEKLISNEFHKTSERPRMSRGSGPRAGGSESMFEYDIDGVYFRKTGAAAVPSNSDDPFNNVKKLIQDFIFNQ